MSSNNYDPALIASFAFDAAKLGKDLTWVIKYIKSHPFSFSEGSTPKINWDWDSRTSLF